MICRYTAIPFAPSAMRIPISRVLRDDARGHAEDTDGGQDQRERRERPEQRQHEATKPDRLGVADHLPHRTRRHPVTRWVDREELRAEIGRQPDPGPDGHHTFAATTLSALPPNRESGS